MEVKILLLGNKNTLAPSGTINYKSLPPTKLITNMIKENRIIQNRIIQEILNGREIQKEFFPGMDKDI